MHQQPLLPSLLRRPFAKLGKGAASGRRAMVGRQRSRRVLCCCPMMPIVKPSAATASHIEVHIIQVRRNNLICDLHMPDTVQRDVLARALHIAMTYTTYKANKTGCILLLAHPPDLDGHHVMPLSGTPSSLVGRTIFDPVEADLRQSFSQDGWTVIDGKRGTILQANSQIWCKPSQLFVLKNHGTRHQAALQLAAELECVVLTRSEDGYVTVFCSNDIQNTQDPRCFRIEDEDARLIPVWHFQLVATGNELVHLYACIEEGQVRMLTPLLNDNRIDLQLMERLEVGDEHTTARGSQAVRIQPTAINPTTSDRDNLIFLVQYALLFGGFGALIAAVVAVFGWALGTPASRAWDLVRKLL